MNPFGTAIIGTAELHTLTVTIRESIIPLIFIEVHGSMRHSLHDKPCTCTSNGIHCRLNLTFLRALCLTFVCLRPFGRNKDEYIILRNVRPVFFFTFYHKKYAAELRKLCALVNYSLD
jgi:hypothetical protein